VGTVVAAALLFGEIGFRPDIAEAVHSIQFLFKSVVTIFVSRHGRPGLVEAFTPNEDFRSSSPLLVTPILLACDVDCRKVRFGKAAIRAGFSRVTTVSDAHGAAVDFFLRPCPSRYLPTSNQATGNLDVLSGHPLEMIRKNSRDRGTDVARFAEARRPSTNGYCCGTA
jgi:hypothetical protein